MTNLCVVCRDSFPEHETLKASLFGLADANIHDGGHVCVGCAREKYDEFEPDRLSARVSVRGPTPALRGKVKPVDA